MPEAAEAKHGNGSAGRGHGYQGSLTPEQQDTLTELKKRLDSEHGIRSEASPVEDRYRTAEYADPETRFELELLRFLRARRFDLQKTIDMYVAARLWRKSVQIEQLYADVDWSRAKEAFRQHYPTYIHHVDKTGSPVHIHEISKIELDKLFKVITPDEAVQFLFLLSESNLRERFPACTLRLPVQDPHRPVETVTAIFDLQGISLRGFWKAKDLLYKLVTISDNYYPETANRLFVINAPGMFSTVWSYLKGWLDARTAERVSVLGSDYTTRLLEHIEAKDLPRHLGGDCVCADREHGCKSGDIGPWNTATSQGA